MVIESELLKNLDFAEVIETFACTNLVKMIYGYKNNNLHLNISS